MLTRSSIAFAFLFFVLNIRYVFDVGAVANIFDKGMFLIAALFIVLTRPVNKMIMMLLLANIFMIVFLGFGTTYPDFYWGTLFSGLNQIIIIYVMLAFTPDRRDCITILTTGAILPVVSAVLGAAYQAAGLYDLYAVEFWTGVSRFQGSLIPAMLAGVSMTGVFAALLLALVGKRHIFWAVLLLDLVILLMTGGRATLAVAGFLCICTIALSRGVPTERKIWLGGAAVASLPIFAAFFGPKLLTRFANSGENGRELIWPFLENLHAKYPWTGIGFAHQYDATPRDIAVRVGSSAAHNDFLRLKLELGTLGMPLMYAMLSAAVFISATRGGRVYPLMLAAYAGFLFLSTSDNALSNPAYFPVFVIAAMAKYLFDMTNAPELNGRPRKLWREAYFP